MYFSFTLPARALCISSFSLPVKRRMGTGVFLDAGCGTISAYSGPASSGVGTAQSHIYASQIIPLTVHDNVRTLTRILNSVSNMVPQTLTGAGTPDIIKSEQPGASLWNRRFENAAGCLIAKGGWLYDSTMTLVWECCQLCRRS